MSISAAVATLRPTIQRLAEFAALQPDWDSYGGLPSSPRAVSTATELLVLLADRLPDVHPELIVPFAVAPIADGGVQLEWRDPRRSVEVEVGPRPSWASCSSSSAAISATSMNRATCPSRGCSTRSLM